MLNRELRNDMRDVAGEFDAVTRGLEKLLKNAKTTDEVIEIADILASQYEALRDLHKVLLDDVLLETKKVVKEA